jgi:hypothetical protein
MKHFAVNVFDSNGRDVFFEFLSHFLILKYFKEIFNKCVIYKLLQVIVLLYNLVYYIYIYISRK